MPDFLKMLLPLLFLLTVEVAHLQNAVDPALLVDIFGTPPTPSNQPPRLEEITVRPTESGATFTNSNGEECQCVPYYLCDKDLNGVFKNNVSTTGWGVLDVRFGANDDCQESVERCCKDVLPEPAPVVPDPTKLKGCGYRNPNGLDFQITGGNGNEAQFGEFPWVVALLAANGSYAGVGVLIHPQVVLTGAHIASKSPGPVRLVCTGLIALLSPGRQGRYAVILKKVEVNMVPFDRCSNLLRKTRLGNSFKLHRSFVCAGGEEGKDTCQGDGGAPLACPIGNDRYKLSGLVAWGIGCGQKDVPAVYARVAMFRRWLDDVMRGWGFGAQTYSA
ncbi:jg21967 [Pararge aegeria aegeria]|uniref:Jg21967 protein n=1 Tax=Pararge aegeria aegeria TaxID=348720 RepID=A0A8S4SDD6_9NEOP|nr:jg21967 [Pararge aegeria aegeria]